MKLVRILILAVLYIVLYVLALCVIPLIAWIFGASFIETMQAPAYCIPVSIIYFILLGCLFAETIDGDDYTFKN